ncbi:hypothetical protein FRC17_003187 [Serendipita sp. 399]|nr:hypothetical protein FRC17_003187 [Serendipita sp. 399]
MPALSFLRLKNSEKKNKIGSKGANLSQTNNSSTSNTTRLPTELLMQIISYIQDIGDIRRLSLASRTLRAIVEPQLYHTLFIRTKRDLSKQINAIQLSFATPHIRVQITEIRIAFGEIAGRDSYLSTPDSQKREWEADLGDAIASLPNLQILWFNCASRHSFGGLKHAWLAKLQTKQLRQLDITCAGRWDDADFEFLYAPCTSKLRALNMNGIEPRNPASMALQWQLVKAPSQTIDRLAYDGSFTPAWLVENRAIKNIVCLVDECTLTLGTSDLTASLTRNNKSRLDLLYAMDIQTWLPGQVSSPYINLTSLGSVTIDDVAPTDLIAQMKPLSFLKRLKLVEFSFSYLAVLQSSWVEHLVVLGALESQHPLLSRVYSVVRFRGNEGKAFMHEKINGVWSQRPVRYLSYWQIANGESYDQDDPKWRSW